MLNLFELYYEMKLRQREIENRTEFYLAKVFICRTSLLEKLKGKFFSLQMISKLGFKQENCNCPCNC